MRFPIQARRTLLFAAIALGAGLSVVAALSWPLGLHLRTWHLLSPFGDSHVWVFDWVARTLASGEFPIETYEIGYPETRRVRLIGWVPALVSVPLRPLLGPLGAANVIQLLSLPVSSLVAAFWIRRRTGVDAWTSAALGLAFGLGPTALSTFGIQEISNTQVWIVPAFLLALEAADRRAAALPLLFFVSLAASFTSPYFALALPLLAGAWAVWRVGFPRAPAPGAPKPQREGGSVPPHSPLRRLSRRLLHPALVLAVIAAALLPARGYYDPLATEGNLGAFRPARRAEIQDPLPFPPPVARPDALVAGTDPAPSRPGESHHVCYLGAVLLAALGVLALVRRPAGAGRRGAWEGLGLLAGGILLSMGPFLAWGDHLVRIGDARIALPVWLLEEAGYPTRLGGLYFRYAVVAEAGLVLLLGSLLAGRRRAALLAWGLLVLHVADGIRATGPMWPRPGEEVPGLADLETLRGSDGAVLELPLQADTNSMLGQGGMLRAAFHGRPTTSLARDVQNARSTLRTLVHDPPGPRALPRKLSHHGFRYVVVPRAEAHALDAQERHFLGLLGTPWRDGALTIWDLGPTRIHPEPPAAGRTRPTER